MIALTPSTSDTQLVAAYRAGDTRAFEAIHDRYHARLERFARRMLKANPAVVEDVVQEAMLRASRALLRDDRHIDLKPWLYRLTRNCALDEISRVRTDSFALDDDETTFELTGPVALEPETAAERRTSLHEVLADLAALPEAQRHALVRREVDGLSHEQIADELGVTTQATRSLVFRARTGLMQERESRTADCEGVRIDLLRAHDERRRASAASLRHVAHCGACRAFRRDLKRTRHAAAIMLPGPLLILGLGSLKVGGTVVAGKKAVAVAGIAAVGVAGLGTQVFGPGDPSPVPVQSKAVPQGRLVAGQPIPAGTAVVRQALELEAGAMERRELTMTCPPGTRVADLLRPEGARVAVSYAPGTTVGARRAARVRFAPATLERPARVTLTMLCKRPAGSGSIVAADQRAAERPTHRVAAETILLVSPGGDARGTLRRGQPVAVVAREGRWRRVVADTGERGWVRARALAASPVRLDE